MNAAVVRPLLERVCDDLVEQVELLWMRNVRHVDKWKRVECMLQTNFLNEYVIV